MDITPEPNEIIIKLQCDLVDQYKEAISVPNGNSTECRHLMTVEDLCDYLKVPKTWVYDRTSRSKIPHYKLGNRTLRFDRQQIDKWLAQTYKTPTI